MRMSKIVRTMTNLLTVLILTFGLYVIMHGHMTPGGGFPGGAVLGSGAALLIVSFGSSAVEKRLSERRLAVLKIGGLVMFIGLAFGGIASAFFFNFLVGSPVFGNIPPTGPNPGDVWTGGCSTLMNVAVGMIVSAGLAAIVLLMALASIREKAEEE